MLNTCLRQAYVLSYPLNPPVVSSDLVVLSSSYTGSRPIGGDLAPSLGGGEKNFADQYFSTRGPYRLIGSLSLPMRLCVRLSSSSRLPSLYLPRDLVSREAFEFQFRLCCLYSPLCPSLSLLSPPSTSPAIPSFPPYPLSLPPSLKL